MLWVFITIAMIMLGTWVGSSPSITEGVKGIFWTVFGIAGAVFLIIAMFTVR